MTGPCEASEASYGKRSVTKVVNLLKAMLAQSKQDGDKDRKMYAKFLCYCNTNKAEKTDEIKTRTKDIGLLESKVEELKGSNGELSSECAKLAADIDANELVRAGAEKQRGKEEKAYKAERADMEAAIKMMNQAIKTLAEVGADQDLGDAAKDHEKFMAGYKKKKKKGKLLRLGASVKEALSAAAAFLPFEHQQTITSFLQAPSYSAQSGEVVGILKDMRDTFKSNLASAILAEKKKELTYARFMLAKIAAYKDLKKMLKEKKAEGGDNDDELASAKEKLAEAKKIKGVCEDFLDELLPMCAAKAKEYNTRNMLRANEDAAVSEAVAILDRDSSFNLFGKVKAINKEGEMLLVQVGVAHSRRPTPGFTKFTALQVLRRAGQSYKVAEVAALLDAGNPFTVVLAKIDEMLDIVSKEGKVDKEKLDFCKSERKKSGATIKKKQSEMNQLESKINKLTDEIEKPETGLNDQIQATEDLLAENSASRDKETDLREKEHEEYDATMENLVKAKELLSTAIRVLTKYYDSLEDYAQDEAEEVKKLPGEDEARPEMWEKEKGYKGQGKSGKKVLDMLKFILGETKGEANLATKDEKSAQGKYDKSMDALDKEQRKLQTSLVKFRKTLAEKKDALLEAQMQMKKTTAIKDKAEAYLLKIKPGCDFITKNFDKREKHRAAESSALKKSQKILKNSAVYKAAVAQASVEALGSCRDVCKEAGRSHVKCKACLEDVSIPGYCAGHPDTKGC